MQILLYICHISADLLKYQPQKFYSNVLTRQNNNTNPFLLPFGRTDHSTFFVLTFILLLYSISCSCSWSSSQQDQHFIHAISSILQSQLFLSLRSLLYYFSNFFYPFKKQLSLLDCLSSNIPMRIQYSFLRELIRLTWLTGAGKTR